MQAVDLELAHRLLLADKEAALRHLAVAAPEAPAVLSERARAIEDDALGEVCIVLQKQEHALVEELLSQGEPELHLRAAEQDGTLLDERGLIDEALLLLARLARGRLEPLGRDQSRAHLTPVHFGRVRRAHSHRRRRTLRRAHSHRRRTPNDETEHSESDEHPGRSLSLSSNRLGSVPYFRGRHRNRVITTSVPRFLRRRRRRASRVRREPGSWCRRWLVGAKLKDPGRPTPAPNSYLW